MQILQIQIDLDGSNPKITRTVLVRNDMSFYGLHLVIQAAMGWDDSHLHQFHIDKMYRGTLIGHGIEGVDTGFGECGELEGSEITLFEYLAVGTKIKYEYDFGDGWIHTIAVQKVLPFDTSIKYPALVKGKNACPPEDCGGIGGYYYLLEAVNDPKNPESKDMREWLGLKRGQMFDPLAFDLEAAKKLVARSV
jgi:Plasmid pRiA4b ORF-3-like protein